MKKIITLSIIAATTLMACNSTPKKKTETKTVEKTEEAASCASLGETSGCASCGSCADTKETTVEAYYFHNARRCVTCKTVESVATEALLTKNIKLVSVNLEEDAGKELAKKLGVSGQTLLIIKGDKKENLTNFGFLNARSNPDLFKKKVLATVETLKK